MPAPLDPECLFRALRDHEVDYVLIGGLAAVLHGSPAMTNDADIVPARDGRNLERLAGALRALRARLRVSDTPDGVEFDPHPALLQSMATLNLTTRCGDLDLTFDEKALIQVAIACEQTLLVLKERDGRFKHDRQPKLDNVQLRITPDGTTFPDEREFCRAVDGSLRRLLAEPEQVSSEQR